LGSVAGIVGAGGNLAAVGAGFLFKSEGIAWPTAFLLLGSAVTACSFLTFAVTFPLAADADHTRDAAITWMKAGRRAPQPELQNS
jgi:NNP family nitrate/nitrite transporter-like MFS transporter